MILEILNGFLVSTLGILFFIRLKYNNSINKWIIETSKFVYYIGHPLLDDEDKYRLLTKKYKLIFGALSMIILKTFVLLVFVIVIIVLTSIIYVFIKGKKIPVYHSPEFITTLFPTYLYHFPFILGSLLPILILPFVFTKSATDSDSYSSLEKFLHYVFIGNSNISKLLYTIELKIYRKEIEKINHTQNVYVSGLARAGTTALMQYLGQISQFSSLSYRNLPFLFLPKTGLKLLSKKKGQEKERAHKDGMMHSIDTYEALEEPFWRNFTGKEYIKEKYLTSYTIDRKIFKKYNAFRKLIAGNKIYLAKNNNHLLRALSLHQLDNEIGNVTHTIIPFREPYAQAKSLLNQHRNLSEQQKKDNFIQDYMDMLVHHEFGLSNKVSIFDEKSTQIQLGNQNSLDYWLKSGSCFITKLIFYFLINLGFTFSVMKNFVINLTFLY